MKTNGTAGFTLIETLMAMAIFTIGILGLFGMQTAAIKENLSANTITTGAAWAADRVEQLLGQSYTSTALTDTDKDGCIGIDDSPINPNSTRRTPDGSDTSGAVQPVYKVYWNVAKNCALIKTSGGAGIADAAAEKDEQKPKYLRIIVTKVIGSGQEVQAGVFSYIKQNARN